MTTVPRPGTILTGDLPTGLTARFSFRAPLDFWIQVVINGIFNTLVEASAWTQGGTCSEDQAAAIFSQIVWTIDMTTDVGQILFFATISLPAYCLPCNGDSYLRDDYPELFAAIGVLWGSADSTHFNVPDFRDKTLVDAGSTFTITDVGGEMTHTLTTGEMPAHTHAIDQLIATAAGLEATFASLDTGMAISATGSAGGGGAHNNMQPYTAVNFGIVFTDAR